MSDVNIEKVKEVISKTKMLLKQEEKIRLLKGEDFNLFKILKVEHFENNTHSAFIAELLNPKGSHQKGNTFLKLFLKRILKKHFNFTSQHLDFDEYYDQFISKTTSLHKEWSIGPINDKDKTGGRIDILLKSGNKHITIENKIYANDQKFQIERYCNYKKGSNLVLYLTLYGTQPDEISKGKLSDEDFQCVSYAEDIKEWIEECLMHAHNEPILRESLKQYLILIKKLTHQMNSETKEQLKSLIKGNLSTASAIYHEFERTKDTIKREFRDKVFEALQPVAAQFNLNIKLGNDVLSKNKHSQIWLTPKNNEDAAVYYGIESFSGNPNDNGGGKMFYGMLVRYDHDNIALKLDKIANKEDGTKWWPAFEWIYTDSNNHLNMTSLNLLESLSSEGFAKKQCEIIAKKFSNFIANSIDDFNQINEEHHRK
jgi:hypothetical protein